MTKNEMLTLVIEKFGFEHEYTINFAESLEWLGQAEAETLLYEVLALPIEKEGEGD